MKLLLFACLANITISVAAEKPAVYNRPDKEHSSMDALVNTALAAKYTIVDIPDSADYSPQRSPPGTFLALPGRHPGSRWVDTFLSATSSLWMGVQPIQSLSRATTNA